MIFDEEKYAKIGQKIFPLKNEGLPDFFYRDIQIAFGILASYMQKAEDNASHYQKEFTKRDSEILAEYKEKVEPLLKNSIYTMSEQEKKRVQDAANAEDRSVASFVRMVLNEHFAKEEV